MVHAHFTEKDSINEKTVCSSTFDFNFWLALHFVTCAIYKPFNLS